MIQRIKNILAGSMMLALFASAFVMPVSVYAADIEGNLCAGVNLKVGDKTCDASEADEKVNSLITDIINIFSLVVGVIAVIMIIIGGLKYIMSSGDSNNITSAKNTILYAIIGLVIVAMSQFIVRFVLTRTTST